MPSGAATPPSSVTRNQAARGCVLAHVSRSSYVVSNAQSILASLRKRRARILVLVAGIISVAGCQDPLANSAAAQLARVHLDRILGLMESNSVNRNTIDWPTFRSTVLAAAPDPHRLDDRILTPCGRRVPEWPF